MKSIRRLALVLLMLLLTFCILLIPTFAADENVVASGTCGDNLTWTLDIDGLLTISGSGDMTLWSKLDDAPWNNRSTSVKSIVIQDGVTGIGKNAFATCTYLTSITIPNSVNSIGECAFYNCTSLNSITIPNGVTSIEKDAFYYCTGLTSIIVGEGNAVYSNDSQGVLFNKNKTRLIQAPAGITGSYVVPDSVISIGVNAFYFCHRLTSVFIPDGVTIIEDKAFYYCSDLTSITIPSSVTSIGNSGFSNCTSLTSITIPNSVTSIGDAAFSYCYGLDRITIPNSVTSIGNKAFSSTSLTSITIPNSVTSIGDGAFNRCNELTSIIVEEGNRAYSNDSLGVLFNKNKTQLVQAPSGITGSYVIPDSVTNIGNSAFSDCTSLTSVTIGDCVTNIGDKAFYYCTSLTSITIPNSVTSIGDEAFSACHGLTTIIIENGVVSIGAKAFSHCTGMASVIIPNSVTNIADNVFDGCSNLTTVTIPDSVTSIGDEAFFNCTSLTSITIPDSVTSIGDSAFSMCGRLTNVIIGNHVTNIGDRAFSNTSLTSITIPNSVTSIGDYAFSSCTRLTSIIVEEENTAYSNDLSGVLFNKNKTQLIQAPGSITGSYAIPDSVTNIGNSAFSDCTSLTGVTIGDCVTSIGDKAFYYCTSLTNVTMGNCITNIEDEAFYYCTDLYSVTIPNSVTSIGAEAFSRCGSLTSATIGNGVTSIEYAAFSGCTNLTSIIFMGPTPSFGSYVFSNVNAVVCYPCNDATWTESVRNNCGGGLSWQPNHSIPEYSVVEAATCIADEIVSGVCEHCGETLTITHPNTATGQHIWSSNGSCINCGNILPIVLNLYDSFGDGWNGNTLKVYEDGVLITTATISSGSSKQVSFSCYPERNYTFQWIKGSYANECSFDITRNNEAVFSATTSDCSSFTNEQVIYIIKIACNHSYVCGICTACGGKDPDYVEVVLPVLTLQNPTLAFEDEILYNVYFNVDDMSNVAEMGMVTFAERDVDGTVDNALEVIPGYVANADGSYTVHSNGIPAKMLGDAVYFKVYAKLSDGSYVYSGIAGYHAVLYANTVLKSDAASAKAKALVVAMLNYGAAAQVDFDYKADSLMNAGLTAEQLALVEAYSESMVAQVPAAGDKAGGFVLNNGYSDVHPTVSFEGAFSINYYFTPKYTPDDGVTFYYWNLNDFNNAEVLTPANATGTVKMTSATGVYTAPVEGIAAKQIDEPVYVAGMYTNGGMSYTTPVIGYSLGNYCKNIAANGNAFGAATAVYGYYAKAYFA